MFFFLVASKSKWPNNFVLQVIWNCFCVLLFWFLKSIGGRVLYRCSVDGCSKSKHFCLSFCTCIHVGRRLFRKSKPIDIFSSNITRFNYTYINVCVCMYHSFMIRKYAYIWSFMDKLYVSMQNIPPFIGWIKYISFQAHTYEILMEVQYGHTNMVKSWTLRYQNSILAMVIMVFGYRILAYFALRRMKISA